MTLAFERGPGAHIVQQLPEHGQNASTKHVSRQFSETMPRIHSANKAQPGKEAEVLWHIRIEVISCSLTNSFILLIQLDSFMLFIMLERWWCISKRHF